MTDDFYYPSLVAIVAVPFYTLFITTIRGLSYTRNGFTYSYPFLESIQSYDEFVIDGTREAIEALKNPKIKIIDTVWDEQMRIRIGGKIFAQ